MTGITELTQMIITWTSSSSAAAASFILNMVMFVLTIAGFGMYFRQKRQYRVLFEMLESFEAKKKLDQAKALAKQEQENLSQQIENAKDDLEKRLPIEARRAFYENAIPMVQKQIYDMNDQLRSMETEFKSCGGKLASKSPQIDAILSGEIQKHISIKKQMEQAQILLAIFTGGVASAGVLFPFPLSLLAIPIGIGALRQCLILFRLWRKAYQLDRGPRAN